jgi:hypothetical protein
MIIRAVLPMALLDPFGFPAGFKFVENAAKLNASHQPGGQGFYDFNVGDAHRFYRRGSDFRSQKNQTRNVFFVLKFHKFFFCGTGLKKPRTFYA